MPNRITQRAGEARPLSLSLKITLTRIPGRLIAVPTSRSQAERSQTPQSSVSKHGRHHLLQKVDHHGQWSTSPAIIVMALRRQAVCRTGERLSAVELANDSEAYLQRMQELLARNIFQAKRTANLQHGIEPPLGPTLEQEQDRGISI
jgi:hypothetical protein